MSINRHRNRASKFIASLTTAGSHMVARLEVGPHAMGCDYCFPHGPETVNATLAVKRDNRRAARIRAKTLRAAREDLEWREDYDVFQHEFDKLEDYSWDDYLDELEAEFTPAQDDHNGWGECDPYPNRTEWYKQYEKCHGWDEWSARFNIINDHHTSYEDDLVQVNGLPMTIREVEDRYDEWGDPWYEVEHDRPSRQEQMRDIIRVNGSDVELVPLYEWGETD